MYTVEINIDDSIFDEFMEMLNKLPKDKLEFISEKKSKNTFTEEDTTNISPQESKINELLKTHNLFHFKFYRDPDKILYTKESGSMRHKDDYKRLVTLLKDNNINHRDVGMDVLFIEE